MQKTDFKFLAQTLKSLYFDFDFYFEIKKTFQLEQRGLTHLLFKKMYDLCLLFTHIFTYTNHLMKIINIKINTPYI